MDITKKIDGFRIQVDKWLYVLVNGGQGGFLNPPGDMEHIAHIAMSQYGAIGPNSDTISLRGALESWATYIPQEVKDAVTKLLNENPGNPKDEAWIRTVYNYFHDCYSLDGIDRDASKCEVINEAKQPLLYASLSFENRARHLGYLYVKQFDPEHYPRMSLILRDWEKVPSIDGEQWARRPKKQVEDKSDEATQS